MTKNALQLFSGDLMPIFGLGTYQVKTDAVYHAIKSGYRHIDTARVYESEDQVGLAIKKALVTVPSLKRKDLFITTKLSPCDMIPDEMEGALRKQLAELGLDYVDLYLIHWPMKWVRAPGQLIPITKDHKVNVDNSQDPLGIWLEMENLLKKGLTRNIGVSNFNIQQLKEVLDKGNVSISVKSKVEIT